ncbi:alpha-2-macroglobulin-like protein 1 [Anopheles darlingi]|uniref:alpha-2-macroglobulin-like protein 1 n=1 Tax=Anopheles darlingi TaxID=43151 RepID=UPI0020FFF82D|nr:alpha-2-macroglobulin-like protein 1 [Anopheles darlingi]
MDHLRHAKMRYRLVLLLLSVAWGFPAVSHGQSYVVVSLDTLRAHTTYGVVVANIAPKTQHFRFEIVANNQSIARTSAVDIAANGLKQIDLNINQLDPDALHMLQVWDASKGVLLNATSVACSARSYVVLFQTDKPVYKAADKILFRVVFMTLDLMPVQEAGITIFLTDPLGSRLKQWSSAPMQNGVFEGKFQLAPEPSFGRWTINANINEQTYRETVQVEEYSVPLFNTGLKSIPNPYIYCEDKQIVLKLSVNYAQGGTVQGEATVVMRTQLENYIHQQKEVARKELMINGSALVRFPMSLISPDCLEDRTVWFDVIVRESKTNVTQEETNTFTVHRSLYNMEVLEETNSFHPAAPVHLKARLVSISGRPQPNEIVILNYTLQNEDLSLGEPIRQIVRLKTDTRGIFKLSFNTTIDTVAVDVSGTYRNRIFSLMAAYPMYESNEIDYLVAHTSQAYYRSKQQVDINVRNNFRTNRVFFVCFCSAVVCNSGVVQSTSLQKYHKLSFLTPSLVAQDMTVLIFTVKNDGAIVSTTVIVRFQLQAQHTLNISATRVDDTPQKYSISIGAGNGAYVGLFGVEERTRIMSSGENDLSWKKLDRALQPFNEQHADEFLHDSFKRVGALLLTDGYEPDVGPVLNAQGRVGSIFAEDEAPREHYPETWIWESVRTLDQRIQTIERTLPNIGIYYLMAFALDSTYGLQITKPARLIFSKDIFAQLHIPPSLNRSDEAIGHCLIHNYGASVTVFVEVQPNLVNTKLVLGAGETESIPLKLLFEQVGDVKIIVTLRISNGSIIDTVQQKISVRQRGIVQFVEDVRLIHFAKMSQTELNLSVELPKQNIVPDSGKLTLSVIGSFPNLHEYDLLPMAGSSHMNGRTNVLFFQTALTIYEYLRNSGLLKADSLAKFSPLVEVALQNQLKFRMKSGAFSSLGYEVYDRCGSVWLTAKTVDSFIKATEFVHINDRNIEASLNWLQEQMLPNGSFKEACSSELDRAQINGEYELSLATTVLTSFINNKYSSKYSNLLNRTLTMLLKAPMDDVYIIARIAHLLTLMKHPSRFTVIEQLNKQVIDVDGAFRYWLERKHPNKEPSQRDTETTAYALLANINEGTMASENIKRVAQWLYKRCFSANRFIVTAENLIGLQALGEVAKRIVVSETNISITLPSMQNIVVNEINRDLLQTLPLTRATPRAMVSVTGLGSAWVKLSYKYNVA